MSLTESLEEVLKAVGRERVMGKIFGGSYSDQKSGNVALIDNPRRNHSV